MENSKKATNFIAESSSECMVMKESEKQHDKYCTPEQLLEEFQYAKDIGWTVDEIKFLAQERLLLVDESSNDLRILHDSFARILEFHKKQQSER